MPRLDLIHSSSLYEIVAVPLHLLALVPPLDAFIYFTGEGVATVRPFAVWLFWFLVGSACVWLACRQDYRQKAAAFSEPADVKPPLLEKPEEGRRPASSLCGASSKAGMDLHPRAGGHLRAD